MSAGRAILKNPANRRGFEGEDWMFEMILAVDWKAIFTPEHSVAEMFVRGSLMYLFLFTLMRIVLKRNAAGLAITDVLVIVLLADAAQNEMANDYRSITEGAVLVATIVFWAYLLDWLHFHFPAFRTLVQPKPLCLVEDGRLLRNNMRQELVTFDELMSQLREQGVDSLKQVKRAQMEPTGQISVVRADG